MDPVSPLARGLWPLRAARLLRPWLVSIPPADRPRATNASVQDWNTFFDGLADDIHLSWASSRHALQFRNRSWQLDVEWFVELDANLAHDQHLQDLVDDGLLDPNSDYD